MPRYNTLFGGTLEKMQVLPDAPARITYFREEFIDRVKFENAGNNTRRTPAGPLVLELVYAARAAAGAGGLNLFSKYRSGFYGPTPFYLNHPAAYKTNLCPPNWGSPKLIEQGWKDFGPATATFSDTAANAFEQPTRSATWSITTTANAIPTAAVQSFVIPIPPTHTLHLGASGSATGTASVMLANAAGTVSALTLLSPTASTRLNTTVTGASTPYVRIWIGRTSAVASTLTLASIMAQIAPTGSPPALTGVHVAGDGNTGFEFDDDAMPETYLTYNLKALSTTLREVGAWR